MENKPENKENQLGNLHGQDTGAKGNRPESTQAAKADGRPDNDAETDKYLAMEQPGVTYTQDTDPTLSSDQMDFGSESRKNQWNSEGGNSRNSDAFNQDDYLLEDNLDLDEDQSQSVSSDDEDFEETNERYTN